MKVRANNFWRLIFIVYTLLLVSFVIVKFGGLNERISSIEWNRDLGNYNYNLVPFRTISSYYRLLAEPFAYTNLLGNVIAFVPLGFLLPLVSKQGIKFIQTIFICFISIIAIEIFQFLFKVGYFDIDDIILNTIGCFIGRTVLTVFQIVLKEPVQKVLN